MEKKDLKKLIELSAQGFKCPHKSCCEYEKYNQCYNHSHVICIEFEKFYANHVTGYINTEEREE